MTLREALMGTTFLRNAPDQPGGGGAPAAPVPEAPAAAAPAPEPAAPSASAAEPAGGASAPPAETPAAPEAPKPAEGAPAGTPDNPAGGQAERPDAAAPDKPVEGAAAPEAPKGEPSLLEQATKKVGETKPDEAAPAGDAPAAQPDGAQPEAPKYEFRAPDGVEFDATRLGEYTTYLQEHKIAPDVGQALLDRHAAEMQIYATSVYQKQMDAWRDTNRKWQDEAKADPEFGGSGFETNMRKVAMVRDMFVPENERAAFDQFCSVTGAGNHPQFLRMLNRVAAWFNEPNSEVPAGAPPPNAGQAPRKGRGLQNFYKPPT